jgi:hypothetical protein
MKAVFSQLEEIGKRLSFVSAKTDKVLTWLENGKPVRTFYILASALIHRALEQAEEQSVIVIPGGRAALVAYKQERDPSLKERDPSLKERLKKHHLVKYRLLRNLLDLPILTRETFNEQIASDPVEKSTGQMMMF